MKYLFLLLLFLTACASDFSETTVTRVVDGDTFIIASGEKVRLICINTPEKNEPLYEEATAYLESLVLNKEVTLEKDVTNRDEYGRLLRYAYINNQSVNKAMIESGFAEIYRIPPNIKHCDLFAAS